MKPILLTREISLAGTGGRVTHTPGDGCDNDPATLRGAADEASDEIREAAREAGAAEDAEEAARDAARTLEKGSKEAGEEK